jgi:hypothetical protein
MCQGGQGDQGKGGVKGTGVESGGLIRFVGRLDTAFRTVKYRTASWVSSWQVVTTTSG